jgi:hypothetical protein
MRWLFTSLLLSLGATLPASAATVEERIAAELQAQGYEIVEANRTWLGRLRFVAETDHIRREIVVNPGTGEILRDYSERAESSDTPQVGPSEPAVVTRSLSAGGNGQPDAAGEAPDPGNAPAGDDTAGGEPAAGPPVEDDPEEDIPLVPEPLIPAESE